MTSAKRFEREVLCAKRPVTIDLIDFILGNCPHEKSIILMKNNRNILK